MERGGSKVISTTPLRLGVVRFLNTQPIIAGLEQLDDVELHAAVPSQLVDMLDQGDVDVALCSSIDYLRSCHSLLILPAPPLGCLGPTMTVRLFSSCPLETVERVYCDTDSHTSIVLLQVIMQERWGRSIEVLPLDTTQISAWPDSVLLIGDKVMSNAPSDTLMPYQLDLGEAWQQLTGFPFLFAVWLARSDSDHDRLRTACAILDRQYRYNRMHLEGLIAEQSSLRDWSYELAHDYLSNGIRYEFGSTQRQGLQHFYDLAAQHGLIRASGDLRFLDA